MVVGAPSANRRAFIAAALFASVFTWPHFGDIPKAYAGDTGTQRPNLVDSVKGLINAIQGKPVEREAVGETPAASPVEREAGGQKPGGATDVFRAYPTDPNTLIPGLKDCRGGEMTISTGESFQFDTTINTNKDNRLNFHMRKGERTLVVLGANTYNPTFLGVDEKGKYIEFPTIVFPSPNGMQKYFRSSCG